MTNATFRAVPVDIVSTGIEAGTIVSDNSLKSKALRLGWLFLLSNAFVLVLSSIPVFANLPDLYMTWFGVNDIIRTLEPLVALPFQLLIFLETGIIKLDNESGFSKTSFFATLVFAFSASLYQQGAGIHTGATMFKNVVETLKEMDGSVQQYPILLHMYEYIRDTWEHIISHYMYASGGIILSGLYAVLFRGFIIPNGISERKIITVWGIASVLYGLVVAAVAIEYPSGYFVALPLIFVWGFAILGYLLYKTDTQTLKGVKTIGYSIVLQSYILSYFVALIIIIGWVSVNGFASRNQPKDK